MLRVFDVKDGLTDEILEEGKIHLREQGYVALANAIPPDSVGRIRAAFEAAFAKKTRDLAIRPFEVSSIDSRKNDVHIKFEPAGGNHDVNRWNMHVPSTSEFINDDLVANPKFMPLVWNSLGSDCRLYLFCADINMPMSTVQSTHQDDSRPGIVTMNIPLIDVHPEHGPMEFWPRSHLRNATGANAVFETGRLSLSPETIREYVRVLPSELLTVPAGTVFIRDHRLLHRGTPNRTNVHRPHLSMYWHRASPAPYRAAALTFDQLARRLRRSALGSGVVRSSRVLAFGAGMDRVVAEFATDRLGSRRIPADVWGRLSPEGQHALRFADVEGEPARIGAGRSAAATARLLAYLAMFSIYAVKPRAASKEAPV